MASIGETKARLLRGAVQDNIATVQGVRIVRTKPQARRRFGVWIFGALSAIALVYLLAVPAQFLPNRASVQSTTPVSAAAINVDLTPEPTVPLSHPRPIDRTAIPLSIKTIVIDPGHGGEPGATAESGLTEKEITLDVALRLRRLLSNSPFEVF
jgi:N-acetylmuramoyl-L-alanine amidase